MPAFPDAKWNSAAALANSNCYAYALDHVGKRRFDPGQLTGHTPLVPPETGTPQIVVSRAMADGLSPIHSPHACPSSAWVVALVIAPPQFRLATGDYHWYRRDVDGLWSHKMGMLRPSRIDELGFAVQDPSLCHRGPYMYFAGFFSVQPTALRWPPHL